MKEKFVAQMIVTSIILDLQRMKNPKISEAVMDVIMEEETNDRWVAIAVENIKKLPSLP